MYLTDTSRSEIVDSVTNEYTDRRRLVALELAASGIDFDQYVVERRRQGDSWAALSVQLHDEHGVDVPQGTLHRWYRSELQQAS